jgi:hypothetical protein
MPICWRQRVLRVQDFEVWRPLVEYAQPYVVNGRSFNGDVRIKAGHMISGAMLPQPPMVPGRAMQVEDDAEQEAPFEVIRQALRADGVPAVEFNVDIDAAGAVTVRVVVGSERRSGPLGEVDLVEGALPDRTGAARSSPRRSIREGWSTWWSWRGFCGRCGPTRWGWPTRRSPPPKCGWVLSCRRRRGSCTG